MSDSPAPDEEAIAFGHRMLDLARAGDDQLLEYVDAGVPVNLTAATGDTLLMLAAYHGHARLVAGLAARGADPDRPNDRGQTPLAGAVFKGEEQVVEALLEAGADPRAGRPSAIETAQVFGQDRLLARFGESGPEESGDFPD